MAESAHSSAVSAWLDHAVADRAPRDVVPLFGRALLAIWTRAHLTLGEVSLRAIVERVLHGARARFPIVRALALEADAESFGALGERELASLDRTELIAATRFVLTELLTLLGTLTAEVLTPALHEALGAVEPPSQSPSKPFDTNRGIPS